MPAEIDVDATQFAYTTMPFVGLLGLQVIEMTPERVVVRGEWKPEHCTSNGVLHGGFLMAAVDSAGGTCAFLNLPDGAAGTSTIESKTNFLGAVRSGTVTVTSTPLHRGRSTIVVQTDVHDDSAKLISRSLQTQAVLWPRAGC